MVYWLLVYAMYMYYVLLYVHKLCIIIIIIDTYSYFAYNRGRLRGNKRREAFCMLMYIGYWLFVYQMLMLLCVGYLSSCIVASSFLGI